MSNLDNLRKHFFWPEEKPSVPEQLEKGWFCGENQFLLRKAIKEKDPCIILELGSWMGLSTRFLCRESKEDVTVIAIDTWEGSEEHKVVPEWAAELPTLYETFIVNCWQYKNKIIPVRKAIADGIPLLRNLEIFPQLIYLDAAHDAINVEHDLTLCLESYPNAHLVGDDWTWDSVREGVFSFLKNHREYDLRTFRTCYEIFK